MQAVAAHKFRVMIEVERTIMEAETVTVLHIPIGMYAYLPFRQI
jgi:hypothetical protein